MNDLLFTIKVEKESSDFGKFIIEPLEQGYGRTLGNAFRRVLLTSIPGAAITKVKINRVKHRFSTLEGLREDIIEFILNVKKIRLAYEGEKPVKLVLEKKGPGEIKAGDIKTPATVKIVNQDLVLGKLADNKLFKAEFTIEPGAGYSTYKGRESNVLGLIPIDAVFTPILKVSYDIESTRVGHRTDLDRLILEITTDGTVSPNVALKKAAEILISYFKQVVEPKKPPRKKKTTPKIQSEVMSLTVEELNLPTRIANALRRGGFGTVEELVKAKPNELVKVKNLGEKSIKIVDAALKQKNVALRKE